MATRAPTARPARARAAPICPDTAAVLAEAPALRRLLRRAGVGPGDLDDILQETLLGAWLAIRAGRYRPGPGGGRARLMAWLATIAFRKRYHALYRAHRRRELLTPNPCGLAADPGADPCSRIDARAALRALDRLPETLWALIAARAAGATVSEAAREFGIPVRTAFARLRRVRRRLAGRIAERLWTPPGTSGTQG